MIILDLLFALIASKGAVAEVILRVEPLAPVIVEQTHVIHDDTTGSTFTVLKPWFKAELTVKNFTGSTITIHGVDLEIVSTTAGLQRRFINLSGPTEIRLGKSTVLQAMYIDKLPATANKVYQIRATLNGWVGDQRNEGAPLTANVSFSTK